MNLVDHHTHNSLCRHAVGGVLDYARAAKASGLAGIGLSDHAPSPTISDDWRMTPDQLPIYLEQAAKTKEFMGDFPVLLGLEVDFIESERPWIETLSIMAPWDFLIGSVHYLAPGWDVDNPRWIGRFQELGVETVWEMYWEAFDTCARSGLFDLLAHVDLVKKFGHRPEGDLRRFYEPALEAIKAGGSAVEFSTAGLRKPVGECYPGPEMLAMLVEAGVPLAISSDAHDPLEVGADFAQAANTLRALGCQETVTFFRREQRRLPL